jgi:hypothetical protein
VTKLVGFGHELLEPFLNVLPNSIDHLVFCPLSLDRD